MDLDDAKMLVANGVTSVTEGANMPTTLEATKYLQENGVLFVGGKAANAGGAAKRYDATVGGKTDYVAGANIAGFEKVVDAMLAQGVC